MMGEFDRVQEAAGFIRGSKGIAAETGIILGTGLAGLVDSIQDKIVIPYADIPHFPDAGRGESPGNLVAGKLGDKNVIAMDRRFHPYDGYSQAEVVFPVRVMKFLGVDTLVESNAAGGINPLFQRGDLVIISDHINLMGQSPLTGPNEDNFGPRFPDMSRVYDEGLIKLAEKVALDERIPVKQGVLAGLPGPSLETRAEYRFLKLMGADMVCMSTVPEVIAAVHLGLRVFGVSVITDMCLPDALEPVSIEEIIAAAGVAEPKLTSLTKKVIISY